MWWSKYFATKFVPKKSSARRKARASRNRLPLGRHKLGIEYLESRTLLSGAGTISLTSSPDLVTINTGTDTTDTLTVAQDAGHASLVVTDTAGNTFTCAIAGASGSGTGTVTIPLSSITPAATSTAANLAVIASGTTTITTLTVDFSNGNPSPGGTISYTGGGTATSALIVQGGSFATGVDTPTGANAGAIVYAGSSTGAATINYANLAPITDTTTVASYTINGTAAAETINIVDGPVLAGPTQTTEVNSGSGTFEKVDFANKAAVTVNGVGGADTFNVNNPNPGVGLTTLNVVGAKSGGNTYNISNTSATSSNTFTDGDATDPGSSVFNIQADKLQGGAANTFTGNGSGNTFNLNYLAGGLTSTASGTTLAINAGTGSSANRNAVNLNTTADVAARTVAFYYGTTAGAVNVTGLGVNAAFTQPGVQVAGAQEVNWFSGAGLQNSSYVFGSSSTNVLSVTPTSLSTADVFANGTPELLTPTSSSNNPGVQGGGTLPDLFFSGLGNVAGSTGLVVNGGGTAQLVVNATTEDSGSLAATSGWGGHDMSIGSTPNSATFTPLFVKSSIQSTGNAYNTIKVSDTSVNLLNNNGVYGPVAGTGFTVNFYSPNGFFNNATGPAVTVNSGDQAGVQSAGAANHIADNITVTASTLYHFLINGGNPTATVPGPVGGVPQGDQLNVTTPAEIDVYSDGASPPHVSINSITAGTQPVTYTSIERVTASPGNGVLNIIGDNNVQGGNQNDYFKVRGTGVNALSLQLGGSWNPTTGDVGDGVTAKDGLSPAINFTGVTRINASGGAALSFDSHGNAVPDSADPAGVNALDITPYANNVPQNWGIESFWNQGNSAIADGGVPDLLVYNGVTGVSENIVIQPSASQAGQVIDNNAATNTPIAVLNYSANTAIVVNGSSPAGTAGDTDSLTLRATDPANPGTSGNDDVVVDFGQAGDATHYKIRLYNAGATAAASRQPSAAELADNGGTLANILYALENFTNFSTVNIQTLGGNDALTVKGAATGNVGLSITGGAGNDTLTVDSTIAPDVAPINFNGAGGGEDTLFLQGGTALTDQYAPAPQVASGTVTLTFGIPSSPTTEVVHFQNLVPVFDTVGGPLTVNGTNSDDSISYAVGYATVAMYNSRTPNIAWGQASINTTEAIEFRNKTSLTINGLAGSDLIVLNNPNTPAGLTAINVNGGSPTVGNTLVANGTTGADTINFVATAIGQGAITGAGPVPIAFSAFGQVSINGQGGGDAAFLTDFGSGNTASFSPNNIQLVDPAAGYTVYVAGMASIHVAGTTGDTSIFSDSAGNDSFYAYADYLGSGVSLAGMYATGYTNSASGFSTNIAYSTSGGRDTAAFYDSPGNDSFYAYADYQNSGQQLSGMLGNGYSNSAKGFVTNLAYSTHGGSDIATFIDSPGNDTFYAYADYNGTGQRLAGMYGSFHNGYSNSASGFATNVAHAMNGGADAAGFFDSAGSDTFYAYANYAGSSLAGMYGPGYTNSASGFSANFGTSTHGGSDTADLIGTTGMNILYTDIAIAQLYGVGYTDEAIGFAVVNAIGPPSGSNFKGQKPFNYQLNYFGFWVDH